MLAWWIQITSGHMWYKFTLVLFISCSLSWLLHPGSLSAASKFRSTSFLLQKFASFSLYIRAFSCVSTGYMRCDVCVSTHDKVNEQVCHMSWRTQGSLDFWIFVLPPDCQAILQNTWIYRHISQTAGVGGTRVRERNITLNPMSL